MKSFEINVLITEKLPSCVAGKIRVKTKFSPQHTVAHKPTKYGVMFSHHFSFELLTSALHATTHYSTESP